MTDDIAMAAQHGGDGGGHIHGLPHVVTHSLRADGFDASEDGTGRGVPLISLALGARPQHLDPTVETFITAFTCKDSGSDVSADLAPTLRGMSEVDGNANAGGQVAIAFHHNAQASQLPGNGRDTSVSDSLTVSQNAAVAYDVKGVPATRGASITDVHVPLRSRQPGQSEASTTTVIQQAMQVRRLTPRECERLQGFPDEYTLTTYRGKPAADGPRYKALGNSMAVPVMRWIGERIQMVEDL